MKGQSIITDNSPFFLQHLVKKMDSIFLSKTALQSRLLWYINSTQSNGSLLMTQTKSIQDLLAKTNILEAKPTAPPMISGCKLSKQGSDYCVIHLNR